MEQETLDELEVVAQAPPNRELSVIIPALDEAEFVGACLAGLADQRDLHGRPLSRDVFEVIVVDNASRDQTASVVRQFASEHPDLAVHLLTEPSPGVARARKRGMDWAAARYRAVRHGARARRFLASTDADTVVHAQWIAGLLDAHATHPHCAYVAGPFRFSARTMSELRDLRAIGAVWQKLTALMAPIAYVETVGCNFSIDVDAYEEIGGFPLLSVGEDLAVAELLVARGRCGHRLPLANLTSDRRAACDPVDFVTAANRMTAWGSHGTHRFQPHRAFRPRQESLADRLGDGSGMVSASLHYFVRQHVIKPLVLVDRFRSVLLADVLGLATAPFSRAVEEAARAFPAAAPYHLEDRILHVDRSFHDPIYAAIDAKLAELPPLGAVASTGDEEIPFHSRE